MHCAFITAWGEGDASFFNFKQRHQVYLLPTHFYVNYCKYLLPTPTAVVGLGFCHHLCVSSSDFCMKKTNAAITKRDIEIFHDESSWKPIYFRVK